jgi:hypothetical protein
MEVPAVAAQTQSIAALFRPEARSLKPEAFFSAHARDAGAASDSD